jgi:hypothetical protein
VALGRCRIEEQCKVGTRSNYRQTALEFISILAHPTPIYIILFHIHSGFSCRFELCFQSMLVLKSLWQQAWWVSARTARAEFNSDQYTIPPGDNHMSELHGIVRKRKITTGCIHHQYGSTQFNPGSMQPPDLQWDLCNFSNYLRHVTHEQCAAKLLQLRQRWLPCGMLRRVVW